MLSIDRQAARRTANGLKSESYVSLLEADGQSFDALILGGGISGCAVARQLGRLGYRVLLVEPRDFAWGTSGRSSRLIHGGLRYLAAGHLRLVRESLRARAELNHEAPHLVRPCPFILPILEGDPWTWRMSAPLGLRLYDLLSRPRQGWPPIGQLDAEQVHTLLPGFTPPGVKRALLYYDGLTDDRRLTVLTALEARRLGATLATRCELVEIKEGSAGRARATIRDQLSGDLFNIEAAAVINATGPWADRVRRQLGLNTERELVRPTRGAHLVLPGRIDAAALLRHPRDGRVTFVIPGVNSFMIGTTTHGDDRNPDQIDATAEDLEYMHELVEHAFPRLSVTPRAAFAGLRPLVKGFGHPDQISRKARVVSEKGAGVPLLSLIGGKLTLHRPMGNMVADALSKIVPPPRADEISKTRLPGSGLASVAGEEAAARARGLDATQARWIVAQYGADWSQVLDEAGGELSSPSREGIPLTAEICWIWRHEAVRTLSDMLLRWRLPEICSDDQQVAERVLEQLRLLNSWSPARVDRERSRWLKERGLLYGTPAQIAQPMGG